jgi:hypothetical protein
MLVAGWPTESDKETHMASDAIADRAKTGKINEKPFLKNGWEGVVQVGDLRKSPELLCDLGSFGRKLEEIRKDPETLADPTFQFCCHVTRRLSVPDHYEHITPLQSAPKRGRDYTGNAALGET